MREWPESSKSEFDAGVIGREPPVGFGVMGIAISFPWGDLVEFACR
jgi:hypothetical protein